MSEKTTLSVREQLDAVRLEKEQLRLQQAKQEFAITGKISSLPPDDKSELEFQRYKQDCRKRSVDLAMQNCGISNPTHEDVMVAADKYYSWLITIPE